MNEQGPTLPWTDSLSVGVEVLDADHRALVQLINEVCHHWCSARKVEALERLEALTALAGKHFQREEGVLRGLAGYNELTAHAGEHRNRMKQLTALRQRFHAAEPAGEQAQLSDDLIDWFLRQSIGHDAAIKAYFDNRGARFAAGTRPRKAS
jgi:hemerythrin